ncbi:MAG: gluconate 2-dehydrogenase gamma chain [Actinomycetota bacterium]|nr:gluconate 2-dehydrogenase gamma chain [Actinomycetota bacterium]
MTPGNVDPARVYLSPADARILAAAVDRLIPPSDGHPGAAALGAVDYIDMLLGAFLFDPPRIFAGGPFSGRRGGDASFAAFLPLRPLEELAWRTRVEGSQGRPEREFNGPVRGWQERYREGIDALGDDFDRVDAGEQDRRLAAAPEFRALLYGHANEGCYGAPEYGGNRDGRGWAAIDFPGDAQPRGYTDEEVSGRA